MEWLDEEWIVDWQREVAAIKEQLSGQPHDYKQWAHRQLAAVTHNREHAHFTQHKPHSLHHYFPPHKLPPHLTRNVLALIHCNSTQNPLLNPPHFTQSHCLYVDTHLTHQSSAKLSWIFMESDNKQTFINKYQYFAYSFIITLPSSNPIRFLPFFLI